MRFCWPRRMWGCYSGSPCIFATENTSIRVFRWFPLSTLICLAGLPSVNHNINNNTCLASPLRQYPASYARFPTDEITMKCALLAKSIVERWDSRWYGVDRVNRKIKIIIFLLLFSKYRTSKLTLDYVLTERQVNRFAMQQWLNKISFIKFI